MLNKKTLSVLSLSLMGIFGTIPSNAAVQDTAFFRALPMVIVWGADAAAEGTPSANPVASDLVLLGGTTGTAGADIIAGNVFPVITGTLNAAPQAPATAGSLISIANPAAAPASGGVLTDNAPTGVLSAADSMTAFGIQSSTAVNFANNAVKRSFYVASNAKFDLFALAGAATVTGDFATAPALTASSISWTMAITPSGNDGLSFGTNAQNPTGTGSGVAATTNLGAFSSATKVFGGGRKTAASDGSIAAQSVRFDVTYGLVGTGYNFAMGSGSISVPVTYTVYNP